MQTNIHPEIFEFEYVMTNGESIMLKSTKNMKKLIAEADLFSHYAWTGQRADIKNVGKVAKFNERFSGINVGGK